MPHFLNPITRYNKRLIYDLLLSSSSETLLSFGRDPKWLGGEIGFYGVLHTWGQTLWSHPHVHYIVPGGALTNGGKWVESAHKDKFLFPVKALSRVFCGKFIEDLKSAYYRGEVVLPPDLSELSRSDLFEGWIDELVSKDWVVYCKPPFGDAEQVIRYIGRYTHRVAISNRRIIGVKKGRVHFWYKDYASDKMTWREMSLKCSEFIHRFLFHVLPSGFHKIRHYGFLANGRARVILVKIRELLSAIPGIDENSFDDFRPDCRFCGKGRLLPICVVTRWGKIISGLIRYAEPISAFDTS